MSDITLAVLGGSGVATPELFNALLHWPGEAQTRPELRVVLLGRSQHKLDRVRAVCEQMVQDVHPPIYVEATPNLRAGLKGANYVLNQVRVGGLEARAHDETFPQALGFPGEETIGPGGFANALRTIPVVMESLRIVNKVASHATVLNLTNPASIVQFAAMRYTHTNIISLCNSPIALADDLAKLVERPRSGVEVGYLGMNHLGWAVTLCDAEQDRMDLALARIDRLAYLGVDAAYIRASRAIPLPYVRYYLHPESVLAQQQGKAPRARQLQALEQELLANYARISEPQNGVAGLVPSSDIAKRGAVWYSEIVVPVLAALINDLGSTWVVNVPNGQLVPWLPPETVIEVPSKIDHQGVHPLPVPEYLLPGELRTLLYSLALYEELAAPAIVERNRDLALRALVAHPLVRTIERAEHVLDAVWPTGVENGQT